MCYERLGGLYINYRCQLTSCLSEDPDFVKGHHIEYSHDDDYSQSGFGNVIEERGEELQGQQHQHS